MRKKRFRDSDNLCRFCGVNPATSSGHVIGAQFFASDLRSGLPRIDACQGCNNGMAKHEDYVRLLVVGTCDHPEVVRLKETELATSLSKDKGLAALAIQMLRRRNVLLPSGIVLPYALTMDLDWGRLTIVLDNMVRGLYWRRTGSCLPRDCEFYHDKCDAPDRIQLAKDIQDNWSTSDPIEIAAPAFLCRSAISDDDPALSAWMLSFYDQLHLLVFTARPGFRSRVPDFVLNANPMDHFLRVHRGFRSFFI